MDVEVKITDPQIPKRKRLIFLGIPNSASSSRANGIFWEPRHLPVTRYDWKVWNSQNLDSRRWHLTMWQCVVLNSWATKTLWSVVIQSSRWHQRREFCAIFAKQFHFALTYKNISSVRLGREPSFFMNLFVVAFQWFATSYTWKSAPLFPAGLYVVLVAWKTRLQALAYRSKL